ncbi:PilZ domain-containing protein [bacterium]|nr:PilZ domain-containing protein [bacterium]
MPNEKRLYTRKKTEFPVFFEDEFGDPLIYLYSKDVSLGGIYLDGEVPIKVGSQAFMSFAFPDDYSPIKCTAKVVRVVREEDQINGFGIQFLNMSDIDRVRIENFMLGT